MNSRAQKERKEKNRARHNNHRHHLGCKELRDLGITAWSEYSPGLGKTVTRHLRPQSNNYVLTRLLKRFTEGRTRHTNHTWQFSVDAKEKESGYFRVEKGCYRLRFVRRKGEVLFKGERVLRRGSAIFPPSTGEALLMKGMSQMIIIPSIYNILRQLG